MESIGQDGPRCANCHLEITWEPILVQGQAYCCGGCAQGGPCYCSYDPPEPQQPTVARHTGTRVSRRVIQDRASV